MNEQNQILIYQTEDGQTQVDVRMENETVWLTQAQMAFLFEGKSLKREAFFSFLCILEENICCKIKKYVN
mgnify:CR=1 FL=1